MERNKKKKKWFQLPVEETGIGKWGQENYMHEDSNFANDTWCFNAAMHHIHFDWIHNEIHDYHDTIQ